MKWTMETRVLINLVLIFIALSCQQEPYQQGKNLYVQHCENCHMADGTGLGGNIPPLAGADYLKEKPGIVSCIIRYGMEGEVLVNGTTYDEPMPGVETLSEFQIANIINYINHAWGNNYGFVKVEDIRTQLENCN